MSDRMLKQALALASRGFRVHPLKGKRPILKGWPQQATTDRAQLAEWWKTYPDANIGYVTGGGVVVVDVDPRNGGDDALAQLLEQHGPFPEGPHAATGGGGSHFLFSTNGTPLRSRDDFAPGIELKAEGKQVVAPPSRHPDTGKRYRWVDPPGRVGDLPPVPQWMLDMATVVRPSAELPEVIPVGNRNDVLFRFGCRLRAQRLGAAEIHAALDSVNASRCEKPLSADEVQAIAQSVVEYRPGPHAGRGTAVIEGDATVAAVIASLREYLHLPHADHVIFALGVAVTAKLDGDPLWGMIVGPPSSGKTEAIRALDDVAEEHLSEITAAGLLSWRSKGRKQPAEPTGLLARIGPSALATVSDFSTVLAMSDRGLRDQLYALLRRVYDGEVVRELGNAPSPLVWSGRLTLLGAVTPAIDNFSTHADALGPRWVYFRLPENTADDKRQTTDAARRAQPNLDDHRAKVRSLAARAVEAAAKRAREIQLSEAFARQLDDVALVACLGRAGVPRSGYGQRQIEGIPVVEEPPRLAGQLALLARGFLALGIGEDQALELCRRAALDSIPQARRRVLSVLSGGEVVPQSALARRADLHPHVARHALEELATVGLCWHPHLDHEWQPAGVAKDWRLTGPDAELVARVLGAEGTRHEKGGPHTPHTGNTSPTFRADPPQKTGDRRAARKSKSRRRKTT